ncbi:EF-hand domain-containing protein [Blastopirellula marina]|uniref:EF-hand domain-containing protein n=1 Tax=Blastopirellula marina TaxID=124 RepID=A0A2S8GTD8_9BACT|nr:hypothetical protein [Blastopirellula marina]PQO47688.1 hypothetical protein C5Y93_03265 [Blastopirellula marina]
MIRRSLACALMLGAGFFSGVNAGEPTQEMALVEDGALKRIALEIDCGGVSYDQLWDGKFAAIFAYCDLDGDGRLTAAEAERLPSARALREATVSGFAPIIGKSPSLEQLDQDGSGDVSLAELTAYYRSQEVGTPVVGIGAALFTAELTKSLLAQLDRNGDGQVDLEEWEQAESILDRLDQNDDELIGAGELVADITYPGASGNYLLQVPQEGSSPLPAALQNFPLALMPKQADDIVWTERLATLEGYPQKLTSAAAIAAWRKTSPVETWQLTIVKQDEQSPRLSVAGVAPSDQAAEIPCLQAAGTWVTVRADQGQTASRIARLREDLQESFARLDADQDGRLTEEERAKGNSGFGPAMIAVWDRDANRVLTKEEISAWLDLQQEIGSSLVMATILDCGDGLLELLDADRNGALSRRELRQATARLAAAGCLQDGKVDLAKLPRQLLVTVSQGMPTSVLGEIERRGPDWFLSMDRNADGHVSKDEFVGGLDAFQSLDANRDGLITVEEVEHLHN